MIKKATVFRFNTPVQQCFSAQSLEEALRKCPSRDCQPTETETQGWIAPDPGSNDLVEQVGDNYYLTLRVCEKKIPPAAFKSELAKRVKKAEQASGEKLKRAAKQEIEEQLRLELLPKTLQSERTVVLAIDTKQHLLIIGESRKNAEGAASALRQALESLPITPIASEQPPGVTFGNMILEELEVEGVSLGDAATLMNQETKEKATFTKTDLHCDEVIAHVRSQMYPTKIKMHFGDVCSAAISDAFDFTGIAVTETTKERQGYDEIEDASARIRTEFFLWSSSVTYALQFLDAAVTIVPEKP